MAEEREKIEGDTASQQNRQLSKLLTTLWLDRRVEKIERETRDDGEYWLLTHD